MKLGNYFLEGGAMPAPEAQGGQDPLAMLLQGCQLALETQDCQVAMQVCQMVLEMLGGGGQAPAPEEGAPAPEPAQGEPVYRRGGRLVGRIRK